MTDVERIEELEGLLSAHRRQLKRLLRNYRDVSQEFDTFYDIYSDPDFQAANALLDGKGSVMETEYRLLSAVGRSAIKLFKRGDLADGPLAEAVEILINFRQKPQ